MENTGNKSKEVYNLGQSLWYDNIQRNMLHNGKMESMIERGEIYGVTSNPSIFNNAIAKSNDYDDQLIPMSQEGKSPKEIYEALAIADIQHAADLFSGVYKSTGGQDGYVSFEVDPDLAHDTEATCREAQRLWSLVDRPNLMIKIPATLEGIPAIRQSIANGLNINVTLIFSQTRHEEVIEAYISGLEDRLNQGGSIDTIASVASFFLSRIDTKVDARLGEVKAAGDHDPAALMGSIAISNAKMAYHNFGRIFGGIRFDKLKEKGANVQRPLWASTSTKNPNYSDVLYVESLIGADTVNTVPPKTLNIFMERGSVGHTLGSNLDQAMKNIKDLDTYGISLDEITMELESEGVAAFSQAFADLLEAIEIRRNIAVTG